MDISSTLEPHSDQLDAIDLTTGPRIFTVKGVSKGDAEQPVQVHLVEFPRGPWRPGKNMRRVLAACWGVDASAWTGRQVELYRDPAVTFGKETPGGTRIARLSHIDGQQKIPLLVSRGKSGTYVVDQLPATAAPAASDTAESVADTTLVAAEPADAPGANVGGLQVPTGELRKALAALNPHQRETLFAACGIEAGMKLGDVRGLLAAKWGELELPDYDGEPVPVSLLGAIYEAQRASRDPSVGAEAFQHELDTGQRIDAGTQASLEVDHAE